MYVKLKFVFPSKTKSFGKIHPKKGGGFKLMSLYDKNNWSLLYNPPPSRGSLVGLCLTTLPRLWLGYRHTSVVAPLCTLLVLCSDQPQYSHRLLTVFGVRRVPGCPRNTSTSRKLRLTRCAAGSTPFPTRRLRSGRPSEIFNWRTGQSSIPLNLLFLTPGGLTGGCGVYCVFIQAPL